MESRKIFPRAGRITTFFFIRCDQYRAVGERVSNLPKNKVRLNVYRITEMKFSDEMLSRLVKSDILNITSLI